MRYLQGLCITVVLATTGLASPAAAQLDPGIVAQGQVLSGMNRGYAQRNRYRGRRDVTPRQAAACANKAKFRASYGAGNPKVRQLYALCRSVGR